jgi:lambda family phage portal protein
MSKPNGNAVANWFRRTFMASDAAPSVEASLPMSGSTYNFTGEKIRGGLPWSGMSPTLDHRTLQTNAREQMHATPIARAMVERFAETVVDDGLRLEPTPPAAILGMAPEAVKPWSRDVADRFHLWARSKQCHRAEQMTFAQIQYLAETAQQRDGEYFVRYHYDGSKNRFSPLSMSFIEPDQIAGVAYTSTQAYPWEVDGITRDGNNRETAYQVRLKRGNIWSTETIPARLPNGRVMMIHGWRPEYASQLRGFSPLSHAIQEFEQLTTFTAAQIQKAIIQSSITMTKETDASATPTTTLANILGGAAVPLAAGETLPDEGDYPAPQTGIGYDPLACHLSPGGVGILSGLGAGEKLKSFEHTAPSDSFSSFTESFISHLSAASGMPLDVLLLKFNASYSASRAALIMFWRVATIWRSELESDFLNPTYEAWLSEEIAAGRISARGWLEPVMRAAWLSCDWTGSTMPDIDPEKSVRAARLAVEANISNLEREARKFNGSDATTNRGINESIYQGMVPAPWKNTNTRDTAE